MANHLTERATFSLTLVVVAGGIACAMGLGAIVSYANHLMELGEYSSMGPPSAGPVATVAGRALLLIAATVFCALITTHAALAYVLRGSPVVRTVCVAGACAAIAGLAAIVGSAWKPGWYYILDPVARNSSRPFLGFAALQTVLWVVTAVLSQQRPATTADPEIGYRG